MGGLASRLLPCRFSVRAVPWTEHHSLRTIGIAAEHRLCCGRARNCHFTPLDTSRPFPQETGSWPLLGARCFIQTNPSA